MVKGNALTDVFGHILTTDEYTICRITELEQQVEQLISEDQSLKTKIEHFKIPRQIIDISKKQLFDHFFLEYRLNDKEYAQEHDFVEWAANACINLPYKLSQEDLVEFFSSELIDLYNELTANDEQ